MPPKQNITKKNTTQKQKQKKAKQQQQQQQGQNVKINIRVGETKKPRAPRKPSDKKQPPKQPPKPPPNVPIQQPQYVPMFLSQQPAQYFTPPVPTTTLPVAPPGTATAPISTIPTTTITPSAPITSTSTTSAPITSAPITSAPITPIPTAPITSAPITNTPVISTQTQPQGLSWSQYFAQQLLQSTIPQIGTLPIQQPQKPIQQPKKPPVNQTTPSSPTIVPIPNENVPSIELNTFTNFTPRQDITSNLIAFKDLDEPMTYSFFDYAGSFSDVNDWVQEAINDFDKSNSTRFTDNEIQTEQPMVRDFGTQFEGFMPQTQDSGIQTDISKTLRNMEIQTDEQILQIPQIPQIPQPSLQIPKEFTAPTQDIQPSAVQKIVDLTQENLQKLGGISQNKEYAPSEISSITEGTSMSINTDISKLIQQEAKKRQERQQTIDEIMEKQKEKKKEEKKSEGMMGQII